MNAPIRTRRFLDLYHAGEVTQDEIEGYIEAWHLGNSHVQLHVFLGLTWGEFRTWLTDHWLPTVAEHAVERADAVRMGGDDEEGYLLRVHPPQNCRPPCPVHWPSDHPLAGAQMWWTEEGFLTRRCAHNLFHPDPDDQQVRLHPELNEHDCDGCCTARVVDGQSYEDDPPLNEVLCAFDDRVLRRDMTRGPGEHAPPGHRQVGQ